MKGRRRLYKYNLGQLVRISHKRKPFTHAHNEQWTYELFKINQRYQMEAIPLYKLVDMLESPILGVFYQSELQPINKTEDSIWDIEKIIRRRKRGSVIEYLVKWFGYSNKFNSWVKKSEVKNI